jgi:catechol 2,3-dioxygenase-like lactoylglutathione lyase family enzyme
VTGIGGVFFRARDPEGLKAWYAEHLGLPTDAPLHEEGPLVWKESYGRFGWAVDPEGNRFELWEPAGDW